MTENKKEIKMIRCPYCGKFIKIEESESYEDQIV
jgi:DNA-directed RNA polymerase subunit RPC12/RpoP